MMRGKAFKFIRIIYIMMMCNIVCADPTNTQPAIPPQESANEAAVNYTGALTYVDITDPFVISVATFGAKQIQRGYLYKIINGQVKGLKNWVYVFLIEVVDAYGVHHRYNVQVYVPSDGKPWQLVYFTAVNY